MTEYQSEKIRKKYIVYCSLNLSYIECISLYILSRAGGENLKKKLLIVLVSMAVLTGLLSGCVTESPEEEPEEPTVPEADFETDATAEEAFVGELITFTDTSTGDVTAWSWDFGDGTNATVQNPTHSYEEIGNYTVTLNVTYADGNTSEATMTLTVEYQGPTAAFTYPDNITVNASFQFTDNSTVGDANITAWSWDFGDGTNATVQNPTHTYSMTGNYTVSLTVTDANEKMDTAETTITVEAEEA